jgi:hypothetical protein
MDTLPATKCAGPRSTSCNFVTSDEVFTNSFICKMDFIWLHSSCTGLGIRLSTLHSSYEAELLD